VKKLNKAQLLERDRLRWAIEECAQTLETVIEQFNLTLQEEWEKVEAAVEDMNEKIDSANEFKTEIYGEMESYAGERSERWHESDAGSAYADWQTEWEMEIDRVEIDRPDDIEIPDSDAAEHLELLPESPAG